MKKGQSHRYLFVLILSSVHFLASAQGDSTRQRFVTALLETGLRQGEAYAMLAELTSIAPHRLSGSQDAAKAVEWAKRTMEKLGFEKVHLEPVNVPRWVRGEKESLVVRSEGSEVSLSVTALGGSVGTDDAGVEGEVIEVRSFEQLRSLGASVRGSIVFFNRPMDPGYLNTFDSYVAAVDQRSRGAMEAGRMGARAAIVRSMSLLRDDKPHTGAMSYTDTIPKIPAAAVSTAGADRLSSMLKSGSVRARLTLSCQTLSDVESANVVGQITGTQLPNEVIVVGGHLDAWDKGTGAHDDGAGCVQAIEVLRLLKTLSVKPRRTIRAVMFMNEENGTRGARAYPVAPERQGERHVAAIESDRGGLAPRGFDVQADSLILHRVLRWKHLFDMIEAGRIAPGYGGVDISPLAEQGVPAFGLNPETHRYFDYHHSDNDTIDKVHPRELEMGAIVEALLAYLVSEEGLEQ